MTNPSAPRSPVVSALVVVGLGTVVVAVIAAVIGLLSDNFAATFGRVGTIGMIIVAVVGVLAAAWPSLTTRRGAGS